MPRAAMAPGIERRAETGRGFTLIEILVVLALFALLVGAAAPSLSGWLKEKALRAPSRRMELLARTARLDAIGRGRPFDLVVRPGSLSLEPASPGGDAGGTLPAPYEIPSGFSVETMAWGETAFSSRAEFRWRFQPSGLCPPLRIRFVEGRSYVVLGFNPLTAAVSEESYEVH